MNGALRYPARLVDPAEVRCAAVALQLSARMLQVPADERAAVEDQVRRLNALADEVEQLRNARDRARTLCNGWMQAAMDVVPITTMAFDPMNPEAFAASRRQVVDQLSADRDAALSELERVRTASVERPA